MTNPNFLSVKTALKLAQAAMNVQMMQNLVAAIPSLSDELCNCPHIYFDDSKCFDCTDEQIRSVVVHLNDDHMWTREAIADWLESLDIDLSFPIPGEDD